MRPLRFVRAALLAVALLPLPARAQEAEAPVVVERVDVVGNQYLKRETLLFYVSTKPGEPYDERRLRDDFRRLWDTGFLNDLLLDVRDSPRGGKLVTFQLQERRRIQIIDYRGSKALTKTNIEDELKKKELALRIDTFYDPARARKVEDVIRGMLAEKGKPFAKVKHDAKNVGGSGLQISFVVDDGPSSKVKSIEFEGNQIYSDAKLRGAMKKIKQAGFFNLSWLGGKTKYTEESWAEDQEKVRGLYLDNGYVTATVGQPTIEYTDGKSGFPKKKPVKWMKLTVPVTEGDQYRVGKVEFKGLTVFKEEGIRPMFKLQTGEIYRDSRLKKAYEKLRDFYGAQGYFQFTGFTERHPDPQKKVVDIVLNMEEDKRYYVGRIRFSGNDTTRDKVIRREVYLNESDVFNTELLKLSIKRINQLGYFKAMEGAPNLAPSPLGDDKLDITMKVEEQNRNQFTFGGGVSGLEGTFINASFSTANFLGLGETFQVSAQTGKRTKNYQIAVTEPYFLDRPITAGFDVYKRRLEYQTYADQKILGYVDERLGASLVTGFPVRRFARTFLNYTYEIINIGTGTEAQPYDPYTQLIANPTQSSLYYGDLGKSRESRITPSLVWNTVDNPWTPRKGMKHSLSFVYAGGLIGGTQNYFRPDVEAVLYIPHLKRTSLGMRAQAAWIFPFAETRLINPVSGRSFLPFYQRFFMGGENQIRGYNIRTVGPRDQNGFALGGNKMLLFNAEYYVDIFGPLRGLLFFDAGQAYLEGQNFDLTQLRSSTGAELRFIMPVLNVPFRLIYAWNWRRDPFQPKTTFKFAVGTTF
jgi:outer membrane protein insertion porin family